MGARDGNGLARSEEDTTILEAAEEAGDLPTMIACARTIAPEVTNLRFRYFDGVEWTDSWDSEASGALPRAIEALIELDLDGAVSGFNTADDLGNRAPVVTRLVVCPPLSEPDAEAGL
ncbi:MAG: hypothetical protein AAF907_08460 [Planctomycetota bacterium]